MGDVLAADEAGNLLTAFHAVAEETHFEDGPTPLALVAVWNDERLLLTFNRLRQYWELPGGMVDPGETPRQAAMRELREETGLDVTGLVFAGHARFVLGPERRVEYAALYTAHAGERPDFTPNEEIGAICWWDGIQPLMGRVQPLDAYLGKLSRVRRPRTRRPGTEESASA
ncbi:NUDIX hydrolase [Streptosporangium carneum]|uniref:DNA mismatch repair protein MutT n=1 Tax=Streptosporangium carneum TaxID=47481 RepID=A0A9W6IC74_9ACTN|nr:NUDIX hydrolase [Streptosporangium carneum]GLK15483.1 DNA mismatch repair protein MutT [Streptosporangium carneum]